MLSYKDTKLRRRGEVCIGGRGVIYTRYDAKSLAEPLTRLPVQVTRYGAVTKPLSGLVKLKSILSLILLPPLTISKYGKVINGKLYLYYTLANLNILLYPLVYITA